MNYAQLIRTTRLVRETECMLTTGDPEYQGTAIEVRDERGDELFHIIVDEQGDRQILFFPARNRYRISLELMRQIIDSASEKVRYMG